MLIGYKQREDFGHLGTYEHLGRKSTVDAHAD